MNRSKIFILIVLVVSALLAYMATGKKDTVVFEVGPYYQECVGVAPMECLVVNGEYFYDTIEGFEFVEGNEYVIEVERTKREEVPADASMYTYTLVEIISANSVVDPETPLLRYSPEGTSWNYEGGTLSFEGGRYMADFGCNSISGSFEVDRTELSFGSAISTRMACAEEVMLKEQSFVTQITQVTSFTETDTGAILSGEGVEMVLE